MGKFFKVFLVLVLSIGILWTAPSLSLAGDTPIMGGGDVGLGLAFGGPGAWGASGKLWLDKENAFQPALELGNGTTLLQLDYLFHSYDMVHPKTGLMPLYIGAGADLSLQSAVVFGARGMAGISYLFNRTDVPVDIFIQVVPILWFYTGGTQLNLYGEIGSRYYF